MIGALIQGELMADPMARTAANGKLFWTANMRVAAGPEALFVGLTTFSESAGERLMKLHKGSTIAAAGPLEATVWTAKDGAERRGWRLTANEVLTVYEATKRRKPRGGAEGGE